MYIFGYIFYLYITGKKQRIFHVNSAYKEDETDTKIGEDSSIKTER